MSGTQKIYVSEFSPAYKATEKNVELVASRKCINRKASKENESRYWAGHLFDSSSLLKKFDLTVNNTFSLKLRFIEMSDLNYYKNSTSATIDIWLEDIYDELGREERMSLYDLSPLKSLFTPELYPKLFGGTGYRKSQYSQLLLKLQKNNRALIFDAIGFYEKHSSDQIGEGLFSVKAIVPSCNDVITYLSQRGYM
jgi:hypothetical protein